MDKLLLVYNHSVNGIEGHWLFKGLRQYTNNIEAEGIPLCFRNFLHNKWLRPFHLMARIVMSICVANKAKRHKVDAIVVWDNTFNGLCCAYTCSILGFKGMIFILNMIDHGQGNFISNKTKIHLYSIFNRYNIRISVNSPNLAELYNKRYNISLDHFFILPDSVFGYLRVLGHNISDEGFVFCGGSQHRDWDRFFRVAALCPNLKFVGIGRKSHVGDRNYPPNIKMYFDTPRDFFYDYMSKSTIVFLPLTSKIQAGQSVVIEAGLLKKPVVISHTEAIDYFMDSNCGRIFDFYASDEEVANIIKELMENRQKCKEIGCNIYKKMLLHSPNNVVALLWNYIENSLCH